MSRTHGYGNGGKLSTFLSSILLPPFCLYVDMFFFSFRNVLVLLTESYTFTNKSYTFILSVHIIFPQISSSFLTDLCVLFGQQWFLPLSSPKDAICTYFLFLNPELWSWLSQERLAALMGHFLTSLMSCRLIPWCDVVGNFSICGARCSSLGQLCNL